MSETIVKYVEQIVSKLTGDSALMEKFKSDPKGVVTELLGVDLEGDVLQNVISAVKGKINVEEVTKQAGGILGFLKGLFGKK